MLLSRTSWRKSSDQIHMYCRIYVRRKLYEQCMLHIQPLHQGARFPYYEYPRPMIRYRSIMSRVHDGCLCQPDGRESSNRPTSGSSKEAVVFCTAHACSWQIEGCTAVSHVLLYSKHYGVHNNSCIIYPAVRSLTKAAVVHCSVTILAVSIYDLCICSQNNPIYCAYPCLVAATNRTFFPTLFSAITPSRFQAHPSCAG